MAPIELCLLIRVADFSNEPQAMHLRPHCSINRTKMIAHHTTHTFTHVESKNLTRPSFHANSGGIGEGTIHFLRRVKQAEKFIPSFVGIGPNWLAGFREAQGESVGSQT